MSLANSVFTAIPLLALALTAKPPNQTGVSGLGEIAAADPVRFAVDLACEGDSRPKLLVRWDRGTFVLTRLTGSFCRDDPGIDPAPHGGTNFDTLAGGGFGVFRGVAGAHATFTFAAAGTRALPDYAEITVTAPDGTVVLEVAGVVRGRLDARGSVSPTESPGEDPVDALHSAVIDAAGRSWGYRFARLPARAFIEEPQSVETKPGGDPVPPPKIHPDLTRRIEFGDPDERLLVLLNRFDPVVLRHLPDLWRAMRCDDPLRVQFTRALARAITALRRQRERSTEAFLEDFRGGAHDIEVVRQFWLVNGFLAELRLGDVVALAARDDVLFVEPTHHDVPPPMDDGDPSNDIAVGRQLVNSDWLAAQPGMDGGCIGILDTGVRRTHVLFTAPPDDNLRIDTTDCDGGGPTCGDGSLPNFNATDVWNHGTGTASVLTGNEAYGPRFRGVTDILLDSWKVYPTNQNNPVVGIVAASVTALERAIASMDRVIIAELQLPLPSTSVLATTVDNAFEAGAVVVAAAGNCAVNDSCTSATGTPRPATIRSPANAHKVLGVGAYNLVSLATGDYQSYGPTEDLRIKPDIQAPTDAETASRCGHQDMGGTMGARDCIGPSAPDHSLRRFGGTSGSTPFAGGVAALVRNSLRKFGTWEPGSTYARMIMKGDRVHPYDEREGAGRLRLDTCTLSHWGKVNIVPSLQTINVPVVQIPIQVAAGFDRIEAAIWWPENATAFHNDIDLYLLDPNGNEVAKGVHGTSVFERVEVANPVAGTWIVKIKTYKQLTPQRIYWAADLVGCDVAIDPGDLPPVLP